MSNPNDKKCNCSSLELEECCEKIPPPLRVYATVGFTTHCCIVSGKRETDFAVQSSPANASASGLQVGLGGLAIATGAVKADAGEQQVTYRVMYMEDT